MLATTPAKIRSLLRKKNRKPAFPHERRFGGRETQTPQGAPSGRFPAPGLRARVAQTWPRPGTPWRVGQSLAPSTFSFPINLGQYPHRGTHEGHSYPGSSYVQAPEETVAVLTSLPPTPRLLQGGRCSGFTVGAGMMASRTSQI